MKLTEQQQIIVDYIKNTQEPPIVLISSCAGSGKTTLLVEIAKEIPHTNGMYLAYNKSIASGSQGKFPSTTSCLTTHALAYRAIVIPSNYKLGTFNFRTIIDRIKYEEKCLLVDYIKEFCLSKYLTFDEYAEEFGIGNNMIVLANRYLALMETKKIDCTHEFYLKLFHIKLANGEIEFNPFDFIMIDEAGDLNEVTLEIFRLLPSKLKIAVGDPYQNIYAFNHTINCFEELKEEGKLFKMSTSFRVNENIAKQVENFCKHLIDVDMEFYGVETDKDIKTRGYLTRTNAALINKMIELNEQKVPYGLIRKAKEIFKLPLMLASLKYQGFITDPSYKHIQDYYNEWYEDHSIKDSYKTPLAYIAEAFKDDYQLSQSIRLLLKHGSKLIFDTYHEASAHETGKHNLILATSHSSKGLEFDEVVIDSSMNELMSKTLESVKEGFFDVTSRPYLDAVNLYYVACTRAKKSLINAVYLNTTEQLV